MNSGAPTPSSSYATIHDVAALARVSIKTVSRVLRDEPHVSPARQAAVQAAVTELGYVPHPSARNLASAAGNVIAPVGLAPLPGQTARAGHEYLMGL